MTMNDQETISSRASLDTDRIEEPHHDDDLDTSSSTSESASIISNPVQLDVTHFFQTMKANVTLDTKARQHWSQQFESLVSRMSLIEHQPHHETTTSRSMIDLM